MQTVYPELAKEWNYERNGNLNPTDVTCGSNKKVWWKCSKGHEWQATISARKIGSGCPVCINAKIVAGVNDLATTHPYLLKEWDYERNTDMSPTEISHGKNKKVWWKCEKGHSWQATVASRAGAQQHKCPICANQKALKGYNDLETIYPELAKEWNYERNGSLKPSDFVARSNKKVWWKCEKGHEWKTSISVRVAGAGCPVCAGRQVCVGDNDLQSVNPKIAKEWHPTKNGTLTPSMVTCGSDKKVWWVCERGHEWEAVISSRNRGCGCPICAKETQTSLPEKVIAYYLRKEFSDLCENKKFSWLGKQEIDVYIPSLKLGVEFDGFMWHNDVDNDRKKDEACFLHGINLVRIREKGCPVYQSCAVFINSDITKANIEFLRAPLEELYHYINVKYNKNIILRFNFADDYMNVLQETVSTKKSKSLAEVSPKLASEWHPTKNGLITPDKVYARSNKKVWWKCEKGHEWQAIVSSRFKSGCPVCSNKKIVAGYNDLKTLKPELAKEWNYERNGDLTPDKVSVGSNRKVWWKCNKGHEWEAVIVSRSRGNGCPYCSGLKVCVGYNDLQTVNPKLASEWHPTKNGTLTPSMVTDGNDRKVWWKCSKGHEWQATISSRKQGSGCPVCRNFAIVAGINDLSTTHPHLLKEWDYERNTDISPTEISHGKNKKVWWKCEKGHSWQATVASRAGAQKCGCPVCAKERLRKRLTQKIKE